MSRPLEDILFGAPSPRAQTVNRALSVAAAAVLLGADRLRRLLGASMTSAIEQLLGLVLVRQRLCWQRCRYRLR